MACSRQADDKIVIRRARPACGMRLHAREPATAPDARGACRRGERAAMPAAAAAAREAA
jgi:hypothetical protein